MNLIYSRYALSRFIFKDYGHAGYLSSPSLMRLQTIYEDIAIYDLLISRTSPLDTMHLTTNSYYRRVDVIYNGMYSFMRDFQ